MKRLVSIGLVLTLATSPVAAQNLARRPDEVTSTAHQPKTLELLGERVESISFQDAPLDQVMDCIDELSALRVVVRWSVLEDAGIERDVPISVQARNLRLSQVLWLIINEAGGSDVKLAYLAHSGLLIVSTEPDLEGEMVVVVYDIGDLLARIPRFTGGPQLDFAIGGVQAVLGGARGGDGLGEDASQDQDADVERFVRLVVETIEPDSWVENGGLGTISAFRQRLVVRNSILVHQTLGGYLTGE